MRTYTLLEDLLNQELISSVGTKFPCKFNETTIVSGLEYDQSSPHSDISFLCDSF
jgi:hypothetical protein